MFNTEVLQEMREKVAALEGHLPGTIEANNTDAIRDAGNDSFRLSHQRRQQKRLLVVDDDIIALKLAGMGDDGVAVRRNRYGPTESEGKKLSLFGIFVRQVQSPLIYILFVAAIFAFALGEHGDSVVILVVVFVNAIIGTVQEGCDRPATRGGRDVGVNQRDLLRQDRDPYPQQVSRGKRGPQILSRSISESPRWMRRMACANSAAAGSVTSLLSMMVLSS